MCPYCHAAIGDGPCPHLVAAHAEAVPIPFLTDILPGNDQGLTWHHQAAESIRQRDTLTTIVAGVLPSHVIQTRTPYHQIPCQIPYVGSAIYSPTPEALIHELVPQEGATP